jgi:hypothetical protein
MALARPAHEGSATLARQRCAMFPPEQMYSLTDHGSGDTSETRKEPFGHGPERVGSY